MPKVWTWAMTSSGVSCKVPLLKRIPTPALLLLLGSNLELSLVEVEVSLHLLDSLVRDVQAEFLGSDTAKHQ